MTQQFPFACFSVRQLNLNAVCLHTSVPVPCFTVGELRKGAHWARTQNESIQMLERGEVAVRSPRLWFRLQSSPVGRVSCCESDGRHARPAGKGRQLRSDCSAQWMCGERARWFTAAAWSCWVYRSFHAEFFTNPECVVFVLMVIISLVAVVVGGI